MKIHELTQGSDEWAAFRLTHHGASEAAAMLGLSKKTTRSELLRIKHTGMPKEFSDWVQKNILDYGHEVEAMARPIIEDLFPAPAGMNRGSAAGWVRRPPVPRASGDEPPSFSTRTLTTSCSPRQRG